MTNFSNPFLAADDPASEYARAVIDGRVIAGELQKAAARRHLDDLKHGVARGLVWNVQAANRALRFFPAVLKVTEGAAAGRPFYPLPWHTFAIGSLFGWQRSDGLRRYRRGWLETGKGQAKSPLMAAIGLYVMGFVGKKRAEVYAIANDKDQANVLFKDAVSMCRAPLGDEDEDEGAETLESRGDVVIRGTGDNAWRIEHPASGSKFQSLANGDAISGPRPALVLADEIHEFKSGKAIEIWKAAIDKMSGDPLMLLGTNTPSVDQITGTDYSDFFQKVTTGAIDDDACFAFIARVDKGDDPFEDESCWPKSLPALGITYPIENVRNRVKTAKVLLSEALSTKRLFFGVPVGSVEFWVAEDAWQSVQGAVDPAAMVGRPCWLSLDLSQKNDLTALTATWELDDGRYASKTWYWTVKDRIADRAREDNAPYDKWALEGHLRAVPGAVIAKSFVAEEVKAICAAHDVKFLAFDPAGMPDFIAACEAIGFDVWKWTGPDAWDQPGLKLVPHKQGKFVPLKKDVEAEDALYMPRSIEKLEDLILNGRIVIDASPVTTMCAANAMIDSDAQGNRAFDKKRSRGRIDGMVTIAMGVGAATAGAGDAERSFWDLEAA